MTAIGLGSGLSVVNTVVLVEMEVVVTALNSGLWNPFSRYGTGPQDSRRLISRAENTLSVKQIRQCVRKLECTYRARPSFFIKVAFT